MAAVKEMNDKARLVGINHVALEVGSIEEALSFYGQLFELSLRGRSGKMRRHGLRGPSQIARSDRGALQERNRD